MSTDCAIGWAHIGGQSGWFDSVCVCTAVVRTQHSLHCMGRVYVSFAYRRQMDGLVEPCWLNDRLYFSLVFS